MKLKQRVDDFRVRELLEPDVLVERGDWRVYRVVKRKLTSMQAAGAIAGEAHVAAGDVSMCGLKDRQGVTVQHMAVYHGPELAFAGDDLRVDSVGFAREALDSKSSVGNAFEIVVRGLTRDDVGTLRRNLPQVRREGLVNYFDDQRFGNLRHGQGWIALDLMRGDTEGALKALLAASSFHDDERTKALKRALRTSWGDWSACRDIAGKFGAHHSVFEHLKKHEGDFAGAFYHVSSRLRLIHLYAYQSHLWNRAVVDLVREKTAAGERAVVESEEGPLVYPARNEMLGYPREASFTLPGPALAGVTDEEQRARLADVLAHDRLVPAQFEIRGISGFQLKAEERPLFVVPEHLRARPARPDPLHRGSSMVELRFQLPRGAYATLVVKRLLSTPGRASFLHRGDERVAREDAPRSRARFGGGREDRPARDDGDRPRKPRRFEGSERPPRGERGFAGDRRERRPDSRRDERGGDRPRYGDRRPGPRGGPREGAPQRNEDRPRYGDRRGPRAPDRADERPSSERAPRSGPKRFQRGKPGRAPFERERDAGPRGGRPYRPRGKKPGRGPRNDRGER